MIDRNDYDDDDGLPYVINLWLFFFFKKNEIPRHTSSTIIIIIIIINIELRISFVLLLHSKSASICLIFIKWLMWHIPLSHCVMIMERKLFFFVTKKPPPEHYIIDSFFISTLHYHCILEGGIYQCFFLKNLDPPHHLMSWIWWWWSLTKTFFSIIKPFKLNQKKNFNKNDNFSFILSLQIQPAKMIQLLLFFRLNKCQISIKSKKKLNIFFCIVHHPCFSGQKSRPSRFFQRNSF